MLEEYFLLDMLGGDKLVLLLLPNKVLLAVSLSFGFLPKELKLPVRLLTTLSNVLSELNWGLVSGDFNVQFELKGLTVPLKTGGLISPIFRVSFSFVPKSLLLLWSNGRAEILGIFL